MVPKWKRWLGAGAVLLLAGAGCQADLRQETDAGIGAEPSAGPGDDARPGIDATLGIDAAADVAVDEMLGEAEADAMIEYEEGKDSDIVDDDAQETESYGNAYVQSEL